MAAQGDADSVVELAALPQLPPRAAHLWQWFCDLRSTLQANGMAQPRISRHDIHAWEQDEMTVLAPWERRAILRLDASFLSAFTKTD